MQLKVVEVTKTNYTLENGDVYEHTFDIDEGITVEEFQKLLDNIEEIQFLNTSTWVVDRYNWYPITLNKIEKDEI